MALQLNFTISSGLTCSNAYARAEQIHLNKTGATVAVRIYKEPTGLPSFHSQTFEFPYEIEGNNPIKQAYLHLKTLPEFADAIDC